MVVLESSPIFQLMLHVVSVLLHYSTNISTVDPRSLLLILDARECFMDSEEEDFHGPRIDVHNVHRRASCCNKKHIPILVLTVVENKTELEVNKN